MKRRPSPALVIAVLALFVAVGGPAEAARLINGKLIKRGTITSKQVKDRSLGVRDLTPGARRVLQATPPRSVGTAQLLEGAVGPAQLAPGSVTAAALTANSVTSASIVDGQVGNADLANNSVTAGKIAGGAVRKSEIGSNAVGTSELSNNAVTGAKVADGTLRAADVADAFGTVTADFGPLDAGECAPSAPLALGTVAAGETTADDAFIVTPPADWPAGLTVLARPSGPSSVTLAVCNVGAGPTVDPPTTSFRVVGIGF